MHDIVVYEDSPFAEYLQEIDVSEDMVASVSTGTSTTMYDKIRSLANDYWESHSLIKDFISTRLPRAAEIAFTEEFKYLIVTSSLLNDNISVRSKSVVRMNEPSTSSMSEHVERWNAAAYGIGALVMVGANRTFANHLPNMRRTLHTTITSSLSAAATFMMYRNLKRQSLRQCHAITLKQLSHLIKQCRVLDSRTNRVLNMIQEIELVSRGYRITTPLAPISRIEQNSKHRRCQEARKKLYILLNRAIFKLNCSIANVAPMVDTSTVLHLYDLYNAHPQLDPHSQAGPQTSMTQVEDVSKLSLEFLKQACLTMHVRRREFLVQMLALRILNTGKSPSESVYRQEWIQVQKEISHLAQEVENIALESTDILNDMLYSGDSEESNQTSKVTKHQGDADVFIQRLSSLQQQLRTLQAKMYLCHEDAQKFEKDDSSDRNAQLTQQFMSMSQDFELMMKEWQQGQEALRLMLQPIDTPTAEKADERPLKELEILERMTDEGEVGPVIGSEEQFDLPHASRAQVFETVAELVNTEKARSKLSRAQRIAQAKEQREVDARAKEDKADSQKMVYELKDVLGRRLADLEMDNE
ncbi:hypothetical protein INT44_003988 [Umbelopsis vinacea]|uniref:Myosin-binding domain-containing protein n=1 Tax=Umbelopsis vinacea TaxID=44442 RepID=A0A8H7QBW6_9FUNG|nr:hypothetical protein INT44_003988 [Umbelopsis vinacea]